MYLREITLCFSTSKKRNLVKQRRQPMLFLRTPLAFVHREDFGEKLSLSLQENKKGKRLKIYLNHCFHIVVNGSFVSFQVFPKKI